MSTEIQEMPEQGEIVLATVTKVMDHGAYVTLDEYDDIQGIFTLFQKLLQVGLDQSIDLLGTGRKKFFL